MGGNSEEKAKIMFADDVRRQQTICIFTVKHAERSDLLREAGSSFMNLLVTMRKNGNI